MKSYKMEIANKRNESLDILKGVLVLLVVWGHAIQFGFSKEYVENYKCFEDIIYKLIYSFHMPLFMAISGYLFYYSINKGFLQIVRNKVRGILVPYIYYCTLLAIISFSSWRDDYMLLFKTYANGFWFLTSVMLNMLIVGAIVCGVRYHFWQNTILFVTSLAVIFIPEVFLYNTHAYVYPAFVIGFLANKYAIKLRYKKWMCLLAVFLFLIITFLFERDFFIYTTGVSIYEWGGQININQLRIDVVRWAFALINSIGFIVIIGSIRWSKWVKDILTTISKYSIGIYCLSIIIQAIIYKLNNLSVNIAIPHNYITPILYALITTVACERILHYSKNNKITRILFLGGR